MKQKKMFERPVLVVVNPDTADLVRTSGGDNVLDEFDMIYKS